MIILGVNTSSHNGSVCLLKDNEVIFNLESERLSNIKHDQYVFETIRLIKNYVNYIDVLALAGFTKAEPYKKNKKDNVYTACVLGLNKSFMEHGFQVYDLWDKHHEMHAASAFYNSGFDEALCIVKDGAGSDYYLSQHDKKYEPFVGRESSSVFIMSYPNNIKIVEKQISIPDLVEQGHVWINDTVCVSNSRSEGHAYEIVSEALGFTYQDAGKVMGMSSYGEIDNSIPPIYKNGFISKDLFPIKNYRMQDNFLNFNIKNTFDDKANFAYALQSEVQENVANHIIEMLNKTKQNNLCLSGGFFLNCVANYHLLKKINPNVNIYIEPMSTDAGTALGVAKYMHYELTKDNKKNIQKNIYYGPKYNYTIKDLINEKTKKVTPKDIAKLISEKNIVAIYQGKSESGPRALGNRSILYDPRDENGKNHVNVVKKREWFRPFAGSVLKEHAKDWFDLKFLEESKFMMYAVDVVENKKNLIPAITHVDGTCRVQTVTEEDNINYYNLIKEFYKITGVPILFNTSFNLAGNTIVETLDDALWTIHNSEINYLYLPELEVLVTK
jgi:carbamoyltransferase